MTTATKTKKKAKSTTNWAEDFKVVNEYPTKYTVRQLNNRLDFTGMEKKLKKLLGTKIQFTGKIFKDDYSGRLRIEMHSQYLNDKMGILSFFYESIRIEEFSNSIIQHENGDICLDVDVIFQWKYKDGGRNGHIIMQAFYNFDRKEWAFSNR